MISGLNRLDRLIYQFAIGKQDFDLYGPTLQMPDFEFVKACDIGAHEFIIDIFSTTRDVIVPTPSWNSARVPN
jgi:hypothetical protein